MSAQGWKSMLIRYKKNATRHLEGDELNLNTGIKTKVFRCGHFHIPSKTCNEPIPVACFFEVAICNGDLIATSTARRRSKSKIEKFMAPYLVPRTWTGHGWSLKVSNKVVLQESRVQAGENRGIPNCPQSKLLSLTFRISRPHVLIRVQLGNHKCVVKCTNAYWIWSLDLVAKKLFVFFALKVFPNFEVTMFAPHGNTVYGQPRNCCRGDSKFLRKDLLSLKLHRHCKSTAQSVAVSFLEVT